MAKEIIPVHITADAYNRIALPQHFCDQIPWICGKDPLLGWLLLVSPGRYRILSDEQVQSDPQLEPIRLLILEGQSAIPRDPTCADEPKHAAIVARLLPVTISPPKPGW